MWTAQRHWTPLTYSHSQHPPEMSCTLDYTVSAWWPTVDTSQHAVRALIHADRHRQISLSRKGSCWYDSDKMHALGLWRGKDISESHVHPKGLVKPPPVIVMLVRKLKLKVILFSLSLSHLTSYMSSCALEQWPAWAQWLKWMKANNDRNDKSEERQWQWHAIINATTKWLACHANDSSMEPTQCTQMMISVIWAVGMFTVVNFFFFLMNFIILGFHYLLITTTTANTTHPTATSHTTTHNAMMHDIITMSCGLLLCQPRASPIPWSDINSGDTLLTATWQPKDEWLMSSVINIGPSWHDSGWWDNNDTWWQDKMIQQQHIAPTHNNNMAMMQNNHHPWQWRTMTAMAMTHSNNTQQQHQYFSLLHLFLLESYWIC